MESIKIYSWNLCFGCMYSNDKSFKDETARNLAMYCKEKKEATGNNVCLNNVIEKMSEVKFDFIGLQEATNYEEIYERLKAIHNSYRYTHSKAKDEDMITIYDSNRFKLDYVNVGDLDEIKKGRPYQILFLTEKENQKKFIVINLHAPHWFLGFPDKNLINKNFSKKLSENLSYSFFNNGESGNLNQIKNTKEVNDEFLHYIEKFASEFNTIVMGDFNDHGNYNTWINFNPFILVPPLKNITVTSVHTPPKTCCTGEKFLRMKEENKYGDYILIDRTKMEYIINNVIPEDKIPIDKITPPSGLYNAKEFPTSDHLPVYSEIKTIEKVFKSNEGKTLRLQAKGDNPNDKDKIKIDNHFFKGLNISSKHELKFPNGEIVNDQFKIVVDICNPNIIGYIKQEDLIQFNDYFIINKPVTLRLLPHHKDPNKVENGYLGTYPFKGYDLTKSNRLVYPNGREVNVDFDGKKIVFVLVQKKDDPSVFGYVNKSYLTEIQSGGYYEKYLKYKSKYLELKNTL
jgi:hypothetical protein